MKLFRTVFYNILNEGLGRIFIFLLFLSLLETILELFSLGLFLIFIKNFSLPSDKEIFYSFSIFFENYTTQNLLFIFVIFFIFKIFVSYLITFYINYKSQVIYKNLRVDQFKKFINSNIKNYISLNLGQIMNLIHTDTKVFVDTYFLKLIEFLRSVIIIFGLFIFIIFIQPDFAYAILPFLVLISILHLKFIKNMFYELSIKFRNNFIDSQQQIQSLVSSIREIKIFQKEEFFIKKLRYVSESLKKISIKQFFFISYTKPLVEIFFVISCSIIFFIFAYKNYEPSQMMFYLSGFVFCFLRIMPFFNLMSNNFSKLNLNYESLKRFAESRKKFENLDLIFDEKNKNESFQFSKFELSKLNYKVDQNIIFEETSFAFKKSDKILIYGKSGCGKSTLLEIISGFHNLNGQVEVLVNNKLNNDLRNNLKSKICYLPQTVSIIDGPISENVAFGENFIDIQKVKKSLIRAGLKEFVEKYDLNSYRLSSNINNISEGQKKRLSLARAYYHDREILLLDELTSNLDKINEKNILDDLINDKNITLIVVSHDSNLKKLFNIIYKIDEKKIRKDKAEY